MRPRRTSLHALVGAYVLDAIPHRERAEFERHLLTCEQCRDDVRGLREAGALLAAAAAVEPRPELRGPTLQAAGVIRQLPPVVGSQSARRSWGRRGLSSAGTARGWLATVAAAVAVVLAVTAVALGLHMAAMQRRLAAADRRDSAISQILGAHDAVALTAVVTTGGTATVVMSHRERALVFTASGLTRLPGSRGYEVWLAGPAGITSAGMLPPVRHGMSGPMVVGRLADGDVLEVTVEPLGGSPHPTSAPVVRLVLST
jgi:anti-sigma-K factor RskA